ncbi:hypothetical protein CSC86_00170, partial [Staphylococcus aureus]
TWRWSTGEDHETSVQRDTSDARSDPPELPHLLDWWSRENRVPPDVEAHLRELRISGHIWIVTTQAVPVVRIPHRLKHTNRA